MISMSCVAKPLQEGGEEDAKIKIEVEDDVDVPVRYASLESVYSGSCSSSSLCCVSDLGLDRKVNTQKHLMSDGLECCGREDDFELRGVRRPEIVHVYCRRKRRKRRESFVKLEEDQNEGVEIKDRIVKTEKLDDDDEEEEEEKKPRKRRIGNGELMNLGVDSTTISVSDTPVLRGCRTKAVCGGSKQNGSSRRKKSFVKNEEKVLTASDTAKKWVRLSYDGVDPKNFIGLQCKASIEL